MRRPFAPGLFGLLVLGAACAAPRTPVPVREPPPPAAEAPAEVAPPAPASPSPLRQEPSWPPLDREWLSPWAPQLQERPLPAAERAPEGGGIGAEPPRARNPWAERAIFFEGAGRLAEAVEAWEVAAQEAPEIEADEFRLRALHLVEGAGETELRQFISRCPSCPASGVARLRVALLLRADGRQAEADALLADVEREFADQASGRRATELRLRWAASVERPGLYGLLLPLSGPLRPFGERALRGALLASRLFSGGDDPGIRLAVADSAGDAAVATAALRQLAARGVLGVVGPLKGNVAVESSRVGRELGVPVVCLTPAPEAAGGGAFRLYLREEDETARLVEYAIDERGIGRFAILYPDTALGRRYRDLFWSEAVRRGGEITGVEAFDPAARAPDEAIQRLTGVYGLSAEEVRERFLEDERIRLERERELLRALDFGGVVPEAEAAEAEPVDAEPTEAEAAGAGPEEAGPEERPFGEAEEIEVDEERLARYRPEPIVDFEGLFLPVPGLEAAQVAPQMAFHDVERVVLLGLRTWNYPAFVEVGEESVAGALFAGEFDPSRPEARQFVDAYRAQYGEPPGVIEAYAYDAVSVMVFGGTGFGDETRDSLRRRLGSLWAVNAVTGPLTTHPGGDIAAEPKIFTVRAGRIVPAQ